MRLSDEQRADLRYLVRRHKQRVRQLTPSYTARALEAAALGDHEHAELLLDYANECTQATTRQRVRVRPNRSF